MGGEFMDKAGEQGQVFQSQLQAAQGAAGGGQSGGGVSLGRVVNQGVSIPCGCVFNAAGAIYLPCPQHYGWVFPQPCIWVPQGYPVAAPAVPAAPGPVSGIPVGTPVAAWDEGQVVTDDMIGEVLKWPRERRQKLYEMLYAEGHRIR